MIKQEAAAKTALATDVLLALEELQKVVDSKQNVRLPGVMYTAILWRDISASLRTARDHLSKA